MDKELATLLMNKVYFIENGSDCWIPKHKTRSVRRGKEMYSITYLSYVLSGEKEPFRKRQHVARVCDNSNCFNPTHLLFRDSDRFWHYVVPRGKDECWEWKKSTDGEGYGIFVSEKYGVEKTHRVAYMESFGEIPPEMFVLHKCDNPSCCNPGHLFLGTHQENMRDMVLKGRQKFFVGENNSSSVLLEDDIINMRADYETGEYSYKDLVRKYKISQTQVSRIIRRESWSWLR